MFNKRHPTEAEQKAQYDMLVQELAKMGLKPEDVPRAMAELKQEIENDMAILTRKSA